VVKKMAEVKFNHDSVQTRSLYTFLWEKQPEKVLEINTLHPFSYFGFTTDLSIIHEFDRRILVIVDGYLFSEDLLADGHLILDHFSYNFKESKTGRSKEGIQSIDIDRYLMLLPMGSGSLMWKYLHPSFKRSAFKMQVDTNQGLKDDGHLAAQVQLIKINSIK
jgi:hypothetical protein